MTMDERVGNIEKTVMQIALASGSVGIEKDSDEIDLRILASAFWSGRWWIIGITFLFASLSIIYALSLPNMYKSVGVYAPAQKDGAAGGLAAQYGGLAAMAGINLGGGENGDIEQAMALIKSWPFLEDFITKYELKPYIMGVKKWDMNSGNIVWDKKIYDPESKLWVRDPPPGKKVEPGSFEVFEVFSEMVYVKNDAKSGLISIGVEHFVPELSAKWVGLLVKDLNNHFQQRDMKEARRNIDYLNVKINETSVAEMQAVFYGMIEDQTKKLMLAEVSEEYLIKTVVAPKVAEQKSKPRRSLIVVLGCILGGVLAVFFVLVKHFFRSVRPSL